jgi:ElaB/YqjD/DUF883 family membrane-anchored ribosome-binding protein
MQTGIEAAREFAAETTHPSAGAFMRHTDVKKHLDVAIHNVESALQDLADRLEVLPDKGTRKSAVRRAGRTLKRTADTVAEHIPFERASTLAADTGRTVRQHPVKTALTAAIAGYCLWSLIRYANDRTAAEKTARAGSSDESGEGAGQPQPATYPGEPDRLARH